MDLNVIFLTWLSPLVLTMVLVLRTSIDWLDERPRLLPLLSIAAGLAVAGAAVLFTPPALPLGQMIGYWLIHGLVAGLLASGLYSGGKTTIKG
jgi:hypothetical protein